MSELDVIVIHIRAEQAAEYERLFAERELPRWREYKERGAFISARIFRAAFGTDRRDDIAKYVIAVEVPSHAEHSQHDADPGFQEFNRLADAFHRRIRWCTADRCCTRSDQHSASGVRAGFHEAGDATSRWGFGFVTAARPGLEPTGTAQSGPGGQALGPVTERDERMRCLYVTAVPERRLGAVDERLGCRRECAL